MGGLIKQLCNSERGDVSRVRNYKYIRKVLNMNSRELVKIVRKLNGNQI